MGDVDIYAVLDFEATCERGKRLQPMEIIEFPVVLIDAHTLETIGEHRTYVRPLHHPMLSDFCTELTGITQDLVATAPTFPEALQLHENFMTPYADKRITYVTCGDWDLKTMLPHQLETSGISPQRPHSFETWCNIKKVVSGATGRKVSGMPDMLNILGLQLEGRHHSGLDDCRNIARIVVALRKRKTPVPLTWR